METPLIVMLVPILLGLVIFFLLVNYEYEKDPFIISRVERERRKLEICRETLSLVLEKKEEIERKIVEYFPKAVELISSLKEGEKVVLLENDTYFVSVSGKLYFIPDGYEYDEGEWRSPYVTFGVDSLIIYVEESEFKNFDQVYKKLVKEAESHVAYAEDSLALAIKVEKREV